MKALLLAAFAVAGVSYVGYSYNSTDGKSCLVCPMTGEPIFTSSEAETDSGRCCASGDIATLTSLSSEGSSCCKNAGSGCSAIDDATLTSVSGSECPSQCEKGCCKDQAESAELTSVTEESTTEATNEVVADNTGT